MISVINPSTGQQIVQYPLHTDEDVDQVLQDAAQAQRAWRNTPINERAALLSQIAVVLRDEAQQYAKLITAEMGKPITEARAEVEKCAVTLDYYAQNAESFLAEEQIDSSAQYSAVAYAPLGVVLAIMPWNYPFWQFFRFVAPALAAGNAAVLKHANNVPGAALEFEKILQKAGAPEGLFASLLISSDKVAGIIADDRIAAVTLTGSTEVGAIVAGQAGNALKKQVLELGGSDPFIVLRNADVQKAAKAAVKARFTNNGQSCVNAKRFLVDQSIAQEFVDSFVDHVRSLRVGDPLDESTDLGPMARQNLRDSIHDQVRRSIEDGAQLLTGGSPVDRPGYYYEPTVLDHVKPDHAAFYEETFGPVAAIVRVLSTDEAVEQANNTEFGLGASVWSEDLQEARDVAPRLDAGAVFINSVVASDPRLPFGGIKKSGYGRELGVHGIREFVNVKTISIG